MPVEAAMERAIARGADQVVVLPVSVAVDAAEPPGRGFDDLEDRIAAVCRRHGDAEIVYVGPPYDDPPALERALALFRPGRSGGADAAGRGRRAGIRR